MTPFGKTVCWDFKGILYLPEKNSETISNGRAIELLDTVFKAYLKHL